MDLSISQNIIQGNTAHQLSGKEKTAENLRSLRESCRQFEAIFIKQMYDTMQKTIPNDGLIPKDNAMTIYQDMLDMQMALETAKGKGTGIGEAMYNQMKGHVE